MKKRKLIARSIPFVLSAVMLAGCGETAEKPAVDSDTVIEEDEEKEPYVSDEDKPGTDDEGENPEVPAVPEEKEEQLFMVLAEHDYDRSFYITDPSTNTLKDVDRVILGENIPEDVAAKYALYGPEGSYISPLKESGDGFLFFGNYVYRPDGTAECIVIYAIEADSHNFYPVWEGTVDNSVYAVDYYNGRLYIDYSLGTEENYRIKGLTESCFEFDKDTDTFKEVPADIDAVIDSAADSGLMLLGSESISSGRTDCFRRILDDCGFVLARKDGIYYCIDATGDKTILSGLDSELYVRAYDREQIFYINYDYIENTSTICTYEIGSGTSHEITGSDKLAQYLGKNGTKYYYCVRDDEFYGHAHNYIYVYDAEKSSKALLYDKEAIPGTDIMPGTEGFCIYDDCIYFLDVDVDEGSTKWMKVRVENGSVCIDDIDCPVTDLPVFKYGCVAFSSQEWVCPECGTALVQNYCEFFMLDGSYSEYADKINTFLRERAEEAADPNVATDIYESPCEYHKENPSSYRETDDVTVSGVAIIDDRYLTVNMAGYWYGGGAHGMPSRHQYIFDLKTGENLTIRDFYKGSDEDFKKFIAEYTKKDLMNYIESDSYGPYYTNDPEDIYDQAYTAVSLDLSTIDFVEDGIFFYYEPYVMGPYAAGFIDIFIPYEELLGRSTLSE